MFVLVDMEWIKNSFGDSSPTQLAAMKVDAEWNEISCCHSLIRPQNRSFHNFKHIAYAGGKPEAFLHARDAGAVLCELQAWLSEEDILLFWDKQAKSEYKKAVYRWLSIVAPHRSAAISGQVCRLLWGRADTTGSVSSAARAGGVIIGSSQKSSALRNTTMLRQLLSALEFPQETLLEMFLPDQSELELPYLYDIPANTIHKNGCPRLLAAGINVKGYSSLVPSVKKRHKVCECCKADMKSALRKRNRDIIARSDYSYIYAPSSDVYHKRDCAIMLNAKEIAGARTYAGIEKTCRIPCRICKPTKNDELHPASQQQKQQELIKKQGEGTQSEKPQALGETEAELAYKIRGYEKALPPRKETNAVKRQRVASEERSNRLRDESIGDKERADIITLTHTGYAFFVARGYQAFHLRSCPRLQGLKEIKGFSTYNDAVRAGFSPCRQCKPTKKHDISISIPITSRERPNEQIEDLERLSSDAGYKYTRDENTFSLETPAGRWRLYIKKSPITVEHINLIVSPGAAEYHDQPRAFLSYKDAFDYIFRHDAELLKKSKAGLIYIKPFI